MRNGWMIKVAIGFAGLATVGIPCAHAQAEVDPDHFELTNTEAIQAPRAAVTTPASEAQYETRAVQARHLQGRNAKAALNAAALPKRDSKAADRASTQTEKGARRLGSQTDMLSGQRDQRKRERSKGTTTS